MLVGNTVPRSLNSLSMNSVGLLDVSVERQKRTCINAVHDGAVGKAEALAIHLLDGIQTGQKFPHKSLKRRTHLGAREARAHQVFLLARGKGSQMSQHLAMQAIHRKAVLEHSEVGLMVRIIGGQHQLLHLANIRRPQHAEEAANFARGLAIVIGIDHRRDMQPLARQQGRNDRSSTAATIQGSQH